MKEQVKKRKKWWMILIVIVGVVATLCMSACGLLKTIFMSFPELKGEPEVGSYYSIKPEGALTSNGKQWHGIFKKGSENKTVVYFFGGGVSITEEHQKVVKSFMP